MDWDGLDWLGWAMKCWVDWIRFTKIGRLVSVGRANISWAGWIVTDHNAFVMDNFG